MATTEPRPRRERVEGARLRLLEREASGSTLKDLLTATLDLAEELTGSQIGFFHFVEDDQSTLWLQAWSTNTQARMCSAEGAGFHYPIEKAGVWADCVRTGKAVVHDDYASTPGRKGMPQGHARVVRELTVPVMRAGRARGVLGVGNKPTGYDEQDVSDVSALADLAWDIASRKRAEEALRIEQARLDLAASSGKLGLWDLDLETNEAWRTLQHDQLFGYDELQASWGPENALRHVVPEDRPTFQKAFEEALVTGNFHYELRIHPLGQPLRWIEAEGKVIRDGAGRPVRILGAVVDITERKQAVLLTQELLTRIQGEKEFLAALLGSIGDEVWFADAQGRFMLVNPAGLSEFGMAGAGGVAVEELARSLEVFRADGTLRPVEEAPPLRALRGEAVINQEEIVRTPATGELRHRMVTATPVKDGDGRIVGSVSVARDVTEQVALRARLAVASRLAALGTLVAGVAHEVNNPLAADMADQGLALEIVRELRGRLQGSGPIDRGAEVRLLDDAIDALEEAQEGAQRIALIVKKLTTLGQPGSRHERARLIDVVAEALRWVPAAVTGKVAIRVEDGGAPEVLASIGQIEQVVVNLVTNAISAIPAGKVGQVVVRTGSGSPGTSRLEVVDDGVGIEPALLERVFEPFFTTRPAGADRGTGLGLAISHAIVIAHGGTLTVTSAPGRGSTFRMELPVAPAEG